MPMMHGEWGWTGLLGWLMMLAPVLLIIWLFSNRTRGGNETLKAQGEDPLHILKVRYAKGEIPREEYERMRDDLR